MNGNNLLAGAIAFFIAVAVVLIVHLLAHPPEHTIFGLEVVGTVTIIAGVSLNHIIRIFYILTRRKASLPPKFDVQDALIVFASIGGSCALIAIMIEILGEGSVMPHN